MDKWREILNKRELPSIDENKKRQSIEMLKMEIANTEITVKESYFEKIKRYIRDKRKCSKLSCGFQRQYCRSGIYS